jgi:hypothetical protein
MRTYDLQSQGREVVQWFSRWNIRRKLTHAEKIIAEVRHFPNDPCNSDVDDIEQLVATIRRQMDRGDFELVAGNMVTLEALFNDRITGPFLKRVAPFAQHHGRMPDELSKAIQNALRELGPDTPAKVVRKHIKENRPDLNGVLGRTKDAAFATRVSAAKNLGFRQN